MALKLRHPSYHCVTIIIFISALISPCTRGSNSNNGTFALHYQTNSSQDVLIFTSACSESTTPKYIALTSFTVLIVLLGSIGNILVIIAIQYSQLRKQPGYSLITSLAAADLGNSLFVTTRFAYTNFHNGNFCSNIGWCVFDHAVTGLFQSASITSIFIICINRFWVVIFPYNYSTTASYTREIVMVFCIWLYSLLWASAGMVTWDKDPMFSINVIGVMGNGIYKYCFNHNVLFYVCVAICVFIIPAVASVILYTLIVFLTRKRTRIPPQILEESTTENVRQASSLDLTCQKDTITLILVVIGWIICWIPLETIILVNYFHPAILIPFYVEHPWWSEFIAVVVCNLLPLFSCCITPFIYFKRIPLINRSLRDIYFKFKRPSHLTSTELKFRYSKTNLIEEENESI